MENQQHTPGPWRYDPQHDAICADRNLYIARVIIGNRQKDVDEGLANSALIAAAPDMLAALIDAKRQLDYAKRLGLIDTELEERINAAITKAKGH